MCCLRDAAGRGRVCAAARAPCPVVRGLRPGAGPRGPALRRRGAVCRMDVRRLHAAEPRGAPRVRRLWGGEGRYLVLFSCCNCACLLRLVQAPARHKGTEQLEAAEVHALSRLKHDSKARGGEWEPVVVDGERHGPGYPICGVWHISPGILFAREEPPPLFPFAVECLEGPIT